MDRRLAVSGLVLAPVLLLAGLVIGLAPSTIEGFIPLERGWIQGALAGPMLLLAPGALSLAWSDVRVAQSGAWLSAVIAILLAVGVAGWVAASVSQIGCQPVTDPIQTLPVGSIWGAVAAVGFVLAVRAGRHEARSGRPHKAIAVAAGVALVALVADAAAFVVLFPALSCAAPHI
jgi:hypothetical protein